MLATDRIAFKAIAEALFAAFDKPANDARIDAYWRGLKSMDLLAFERTVEHVIGPEGEDELPTPKQLYATHRRLRNAQRAAELAGRNATNAEPAPELDRFDAYANRVMLASLCSLTAQHASAATEESLAEMIHVKHRFADAYREMCLDEPDASLELRDALLAALKPVFVPREPSTPASVTQATPEPTGTVWDRTLAELAVANADEGYNAPPGAAKWAGL